MTSSPSPPQRSIGSFRTDVAPGRQFAPYMPGFPAAHQGGPRPSVSTGFISHRLNGNSSTSSRSPGNAFYADTYGYPVSPPDDHLHMLESQDQIHNHPEHTRPMIDDRNGGTQLSRRPLGMDKDSRRLVSDLRWSSSFMVTLSKRLT